MPLWSKCVVLRSGNVSFALVTIDAIGADGGLIKEAYQLAASRGFKIPFENVIVSASHSHSGPGALSSEMLWELAPATDVLKPQLRTRTYILRQTNVY